jgi:hypothetical protein
VRDQLVPFQAPISGTVWAQTDTNTLHRSLLSTNTIENTFLNTRRKLGRVTRFRAETNRASRWLSCALLEAEKGFRKIVGHDLLPSLITALGRPPVPSS